MSSASPDELRGILEAHNVIEEAVASAAAYGRLAEAALGTLPPGRERDALGGAPGFLLQRDT